MNFQKWKVIVVKSRKQIKSQVTKLDKVLNISELGVRKTSKNKKLKKNTS